MTRARDISNVITDANLGGTLDATGVVTANAGVKVDNITIDGTEIDLSSGDLTVDVAGDIILDADGDQIRFKADGTQFGLIGNESSDFLIQSSVQDKDIIFQGNDGGSAVTALSLDMSVGGMATIANGLVLSDGNIVFADGHGLDFGNTSGSATGSSSALLDDYEEGTATLSFSSSGSTFQYSYQIAFYTKIGRMVNLVCYMQLDGGGNSFSGNTVNITGLPFTSINNAGHQATSACRLRFVNLGTGFTYLMATVGSNTTTVTLLQCGDNVAPGTIGANQLSSSSGQVMFSLSYVAA